MEDPTSPKGLQDMKLEALERREEEGRNAHRRFEAYLLAATLCGGAGDGSEYLKERVNRWAMFFHQRVFGCPMEDKE